MKRMHQVILAAVALTAFGITLVPAARAGEARTHDGFFLRLSTGGGGASAKIKDATGSVKLSGFATEGDLAIGGIVGENLALHATMLGWLVQDPDAEVTITGFGTGTGTINGQQSFGMLGAGATYYLMPTNVYLTGSVGFGVMSFDPDQGSKGSTKPGAAFTAGVGKEWWVGDSWGLGLNGNFTYFSAKDDDLTGVSENWAGPSYSLRFSATFN